MNKKVLVLLLSVLLVLSLAACGGGGGSSSGGGGNEPAPAEEPADTGRQPLLKIASGSEPANLDVVMETNDDGSLVVCESIYERLMYVDANNEIHPELAESVEVSEDSSQYTYHLRKGVKFHNGKEMTAEDVVASMNRWIDAAETVSNMVGGAHFEAVDDYTVTIKMENGTAYLNEMIACYAQHAIITTKECVEEAQASDTGMLQTFIGTGPYKWNEWVSADHISLVANDDYQPYGTDGDYSGWGGYKHAYYDEVQICYVTDATTLNAAMQNKDYAATTSLDMMYLKQYENNPEYGTHVDATELKAVIFNKKEGWGANEKFRQAIQALINVDDVMYAYYGDENFYELYSSYMFKGTPWYSEAGSEFYNQHDPEKAKALLEEAGFTKDDTFTILCASDSEDYYTFAQEIQSEFRNLGYNCEIIAYEWGTFTQIRNNEPDKYNVFLTGFSPKVLPNLNLFLSASWAGWCTDERIQGDLKEISTATDFDAAVETWNALQGYMYETSVPIVKLGCGTNMTLWISEVEGVEYREHLVWVNIHPAA